MAHHAVLASVSRRRAEMGPKDALGIAVFIGCLLEDGVASLVLALIFSGNIVPYQGQRKKGLEDVSRSGLQGITTLGKGEILVYDQR
jgi:hypothetical protein